MHLGPRPVVMLCGTEAIREALVDQAEAFSDRGTIALFEPIVQTYGEIWDRMEWRMWSAKTRVMVEPELWGRLRVFELPL